jgi:hypothetical protein
MSRKRTQSDDANMTHPTLEGDTGVGTFSLLYLLFALAFVSWLLFDTWMDAHTLLHGVLRYDLSRLQSPEFHLIAYSILGGAMGGIVNGIRSALMYYSSFNRRYLWKYITAPWMGAALALIGFALLRSTVAIFGGQSTTPDAITPQFLANFGIGALAGYGAKDVFIWLDAQVNKLFAVQQTTPDVTGQPQPVAVSQLQGQNLAVGALAGAPADSGSEAGTVIDQVPAPGTPIDRGGSVDLVVTNSPAAANTDGGKPPTDG